jgi:hypothetical protein
MFYCIKCKDAIANAENKCWNCGGMLGKSMIIEIKMDATDPAFEKFKNLKQELGLESDVEAFKLMIDLATGHNVAGESVVIPEEGNEREMKSIFKE